MDFTKMHGLGNDFVLVYWEEEVPLDISEWVVSWCDRHWGIGADGLVLVGPSMDADIRMRIFNADGGEAEQCGNAVRCVARYAAERLKIPKEVMRIETNIGIQTVCIQEDDQVRVDMGAPRFDIDQILYPLQVAGDIVQITSVSMGNPHAVVEVDDAASFPVETAGPEIEHHLFFPEKTNVEFITVVSPTELVMRVWERGVGRTLACGSGACAGVVAGVLRGRLHRQADVRLEGGTLHIHWDKQTDHVFMTGPATFVFDGIMDRTLRDT